MTPRTASFDEDVDAMAPPAEPSAVSAAERAVDAAQRIVVERLELMRLEVQDAVERLVQRAGLLLVAGLVTILGWCGLAAALVLVVAERLPMAAAIALVAALHVLAGIGIGVAAATIVGRKAT